MSTPKYSNISVSLMKAEDWVPKATTRGVAVDRYFQDSLSTKRDAARGDTQTVSQEFWADADTRGIRYMEGLRGATFTPIFFRLDADGYIPCRTNDSRFTSCGWYPNTVTTDKTESHWQKFYCETVKHDVAYFYWKTPASGSTIATGYCHGYIRTPLDALGRYQGGRLNFTAYSDPKVVTISTNSTVQIDYRGAIFYIGMDADMKAQYAIKLPLEEDPVNDDSQFCSLYKYIDDTYYLVDRVPTGKSHDKWNENKGKGTFFENYIQVENILGRLVISSNMLSTPWIYHEDKLIDLRGGGMGARLFAIGGDVAFDNIRYVKNAIIKGKKSLTPKWTTSAASVNLVYAERFYYDCSSYRSFVDTTSPYENYNSGHTIVSISNWSEVRTPVFYSIQELHYPQWVAATTATVYLLSDYIDSMSIKWNETGRGATASLTVRDWYHDPVTNTYSGGTISSILSGVDKVQIALAHDGATPATIYTGYVTKIEHFTDSPWPSLTLELADKGFFFAESRQNNVWLPCFAGWDLRHAVTYALNHWGWDTTETGLVFDEDYPETGWRIPVVEETGIWQLPLETSLDELFDKLAELTDFRWYIDNDIIYWKFDKPSTGIDFYLDDLALETGDRVLRINNSKDFNLTRNVTWGRGLDAAGHPAEVVYKYKSSFDTNSQEHTGVELWRVLVEPDNPNIAGKVLRTLQDECRLVQEIEWNTWGKTLMPGDIVQCNIDNLDIPAGTEFVINTKESTIQRLEGSTPIWRDQYIGSIRTSQ